jgi:hypothetical protein
MKRFAAALFALLIGCNVTLLDGQIPRLVPILGSAPFTPIIHTYTTVGTFTETVPTGAKTLTVEAWGAGGGGRYGTASTTAFGGGGGAYQESVMTIAPSDWGQTISYAVRAGGAGSTTAGTNGTTPGSTTSVTINGLNAAPANLAANPGVGGNTVSGTGGNAGSAGNTVNTAGGNGSSNGSSFAGGGGANGGAGGSTSTSQNGTAPGGGGSGENVNDATYSGSGAGANGQVKFSWN